MGLLNQLLKWGGNNRSAPAKRRVSKRHPSKRQPAEAALRFETMEPRYVLSASPIPVVELGAVYTELTTTGTETEGDKFEIAWEGSAPGTQLTHLVINGDQDGNGLDDGDVFFDPIAGGPGVGAAFPFAILPGSDISAGQIIGISVADGGTTLTLDIIGWDPGERLIFTIDVDEMDDTPNSLAEGAEFQNSVLTATFVDTNGHNQDVTGSSIFKDSYDHLIPSSVSVPLDSQFPPGEGTSVRTAGTGFVLEQPFRPFTISGTVYEDDNLNNSISSGEDAIPGVTVHLYQFNEDTGNYEDTGLSDVTDGNGHYSFTHDNPGRYRVVEDQPSGYLSVGSSPGTGATSTTPDIISDIVTLGGDTHPNNNFGEVTPVRISGHIYHDHDNDGLRESGDEGIGGVQLQVHRTNNDGLVQPDVFVNSFSSGDIGFWQATNLLPGMYTITEMQPSGWVDGKDTPGSVGGAVGPNDTIHSINLLSGLTGIDYDFGELKPSSIAGRVHADTDGNCELDPGEFTLGGVQIDLLDAQGQVIDTTTTLADGTYKFDGLAPGVYSVREYTPTGYFDSDDHAGTAGGTAHNPGDFISDIRLASGVDATDYDFCENPPASISGRVFVDTDEDCEFDPQETTLGGVEMELLDAGGNVIDTTFTASDGTYKFDGLAPGMYSVREKAQPAGYYDGEESVGSAGGSTVQPDTIAEINLTAGLDATDYDFCEHSPGSLSGYVFRDGLPIVVAGGSTLDPAAARSLRGGAHSPDDLPLSGVQLVLVDSEGNFVASTFTNGSGFYRFTELAPGEYTVFEVQPGGYIDGLDTPGVGGGIAANYSNEGDPRLAGIAHNHDAIANVTVEAGHESANNNFSEISTSPQPPDIEIPPPEFEFPPPRIAPVIGPGPIVVLPPSAFAQPSSYEVYGGGVTPQSGISWHLSIINAGQPRSSGEPADALVRVAERMDAFAREDVSHGEWSLAKPDAAGNATDRSSAEPTHHIFGVTDATPVSGDFNGDGITDIGVYRKGDWYLDLNGNGVWDEGDLWCQLGTEKDQPITGDWDGDGKTDVGIFGPEWPNDPRAVMSEPGLPDRDNAVSGAKKNLPPHEWEATTGHRLMKRTSAGQPRTDVIDHVFYYGGAGDIGVAGDWNGDSITTIGIFNGGTWILDDNGDGRWLPGEPMFQYGKTGDIPVVGDWNGDGVKDVGVFRNGHFTLDTNGNRSLDAEDEVRELGRAGDLPVVGDWDGDGVDEVGVYRPQAGNNDRVTRRPEGTAE